MAVVLTRMCSDCQSDPGSCHSSTASTICQITPFLLLRLEMGVRVFLTTNSGNKEVRHFSQHINPVNTRESSLDGEQAADNPARPQGEADRARHHRHLRPRQPGPQEVHEGEGEEDQWTEERIASTDI